MEERLQTRAKLKQQIIDRRVEELLNPSVKWDEVDDSAPAGVPLNPVEGRITFYKKSGNAITEVKISIGSNQRVHQDQKLIVYRPFIAQTLEGAARAQSKYIGAVRIVKVFNDSAEAEPIKEQMAGVIEIGDRVSAVLDHYVNPKTATSPASAPARTDEVDTPPDNDYRWNMKQIGLAMHKYVQEHKHFPPVAIVDDKKEPLLSWRVALLPYLGEEKLYKEFHLNERWDTPHNLHLLARMPDVYRRPGVLIPFARTTFLAPIGKGSVFSQPLGATREDITDGTSSTIAVVTGRYSDAVPWTQPVDWKFDSKTPQNLRQQLVSLPNGEVVLMCDGSVQTLKRDADPKALLAALTMDGGERIDLAKDLVQPATPIPEVKPVKAIGVLELRLAESQPAQGLEAAISPKSSQQIYLHKEVVATNRDIEEVQATQGNNGAPALRIRFTESAGEKLTGISSRHKLKPLAILVDGAVLAAPLLRAPIGREVIVEGNFTREEVDRMASNIQARVRQAKEAYQPVDSITARENAIRGVLRQRTSVQFIETALKDALKFLEEQNEIPILIDEAALVEKGENIETQVNLQLEGITLNSVLKLMFKPYKNIDFVVNDEVLKITTREKAAKWRGNARPIRSSVMLVNEEKLRSALRAPTTVQFIDTPMKDALKFLQEQHGIPIVLDEAALTEAGVNVDTAVSLMLSDISLRSVLNLMFERMKNVTYVIEDEVLQIVPTPAVPVASTKRSAPGGSPAGGQPASAETEQWYPYGLPYDSPQECKKIFALAEQQVQAAEAKIQRLMKVSAASRAQLRRSNSQLFADLKQALGRLNSIGLAYHRRSRDAREVRDQLAASRQKLEKELDEAETLYKAGRVPRTRFEEAALDLSKAKSFYQEIQKQLDDHADAGLTCTADELRRTLAAKVSLSCRDYTLRELILHISRQCGLKHLLVDEHSLVQAGINLDAQGGARIDTDLTLQTILEQILKPLSLGMYIEDGDVIVTTKRAADEQNSTVASRVREIVSRPAAIDFRKTPFADVIKSLSSKMNVSVVVSQPELDAVKVKTDTPITLKLDNARFDEALDRILSPLKLKYVIRDDLLLIVRGTDSNNEGVRNSAAGGNQPGKPASGPLMPAPSDQISAPARAGASYILRTPADYRKAFDEAEAAIQLETDRFNNRRSPVMARGSDGGTVQLPPVPPLKTAELLTEELRKKYPEQYANLTRAIERRQLLVDEFKSQLQLLQSQVSRAESAVRSTELKYNEWLAIYQVGGGKGAADVSEAKHAVESAKLQLQEMKTLLDLYRKTEDDVLKPGSAPAPVIKKVEDKPVTATPAKPPIAKFDPDEITAKRLRNLRKIGEAMLRYYADNQRFPPAAKLNSDDVPLLSWRVLLLPYLGEEKLFQEFHLNEPWNSAHNQALLARIPDVYATFGTPRESGLTKFLAPIGVDTVFADPKGMSLADIPDGAETTALVLNLPSIDDAVAWTKPEDKTFTGELSSEFHRKLEQGVLALFCDGSIHYLGEAKELESRSLVAAVTRNKHEWEDRGRRIGGLLGDVLPPQELPAQFPPDPLVVVDIVPQGTIYVERKKVTGDGLLEYLRKRASKGRKPVVFLRGETSRGFEPIGAVQQACQRAGFATSVHLFRQSRQLSGEVGFQGASSEGTSAPFMPYPPVRDARAINLVKIFRALGRHVEGARHQATHSLRPSGQGRFQNAIRDPGDGQSLLSWRVALLPYLNEVNLYKQFRLNERWDGPNNKKLISQMPEIYGYPGLLGQEDYRTGYVAVLTPNSFINDSIGEQKATGITAGFVHVGRDQAVTWTKPEDWKVDQQLPTLGLFSNRLTEIPAIFEDFSVRTISRRTVPDLVLGSTLTERDYWKQLDRDFGPNQLIPLGVTAEGKIELYLYSTWKEKKTITPVELYETVTAATWREIQPGVLLIYNSDSPQARMGLDIVRDCCRNLAIGWMEERDLFQEEKPKPKTSAIKDERLKVSYVTINSENIPQELRKRYSGGLKITTVEADSPLSKAGVHAGDILVGLGKHGIATKAELDAVWERARITQAVDLKVIIVRGQETLIGELKLLSPVGTNPSATPGKANVPDQKAKVDGKSS